MRSRGARIFDGGIICDGREAELRNTHCRQMPSPETNAYSSPEILNIRKWKERKPQAPPLPVCQAALSRGTFTGSPTCSSPLPER